jgi:starch phosphorylase
VRVGRVKLYLLDTDLEENAPWDRELSARLYGGDRETRVQQEIILGIGGVRVLKAMGSDPAVYHLNEGHAAFVVLQRIRDLCEKGWTFDAALDEVRRTTVFTTHTPVAAGHDAFPFHLVETHLAGAWGDLGGYRERFLALGHYDNGSGPLFNMTALALRTSGAVNGVSQLHGEVTKQMWQSIWPARPTIAAGELHHQRRARSDVDVFGDGLAARTTSRSRLARSARRSRARRPRHGDSRRGNLGGAPGAAVVSVPVHRRTVAHPLDAGAIERRPDRRRRHHARSSTLTIGFARRFTGYKRPELIFTDADRLARILNAPGRPVQLVFAGKAHPADDVGKHHLQRIYKRALDPKFGGRIAFVEGYDLHVAHFLVQGCDVWMNNPRKPLEASGTSGMKAAINGAPHMSIGDGWWAEGFTGNNGWLIEGHADPNDYGAQDWADVQAMYTLIEQQLVPTVLRPRRQRHPARLGTDRQGIDPNGAAAIQHAPDGEGVRPEMYLPAVKQESVMR